MERELAKQIHEWAAGFAQTPEIQLESIEYLRNVDQWRKVWRPAHVRLLLVAESHVAERLGDQKTLVRLPTRDGLPQGFCRLVYCVGYGENELCHPLPVGNFGTWQYWDIFGQVAGGMGNIQPRKYNSRFNDRLQWNLDTLKELQNKGVWLVDASATAVYGSGRNRFHSGKRYRQIIRESWTKFVWPQIQNEPVEEVWVIGTSVAKALRGIPHIDPEKVISQPQDHNGQRYVAGLKRLVAAAARY